MQKLLLLLLGASLCCWAVGSCGGTALANGTAPPDGTTPSNGTAHHVEVTRVIAAAAAALRSRLGGNGSAPLVWADQLAAFAQAWALRLAERAAGLTRSGGPYGEFLAWLPVSINSTRVNGTALALAAMDMWTRASVAPPGNRSVASVRSGTSGNASSGGTSGNASSGGAVVDVQEHANANANASVGVAVALSRSGDQAYVVMEYATSNHSVPAAAPAPASPAAPAPAPAPVSPAVPAPAPAPAPDSGVPDAMEPIVPPRPAAPATPRVEAVLRPLMVATLVMACLILMTVCCCQAVRF